MIEPNMNAIRTCNDNGADNRITAQLFLDDKWRRPLLRAPCLGHLYECGGTMAYSRLRFKAAVEY